MKRYKLALLLSCAAAIATNSMAKPVVQMSQGIKGGISKTVTETWNLSDAEKKNTATLMMMSSLTATAVAPSGKIRKKEWTAVNSQHKACFYNTYGSTMGGKYMIKLNIAGQEVNAYEVVPVGAGQGFCITRYLEMWVNPRGPGQIPTVASTHMEMDGAETNNEGHGSLEVR